MSVITTIEQLRKLYPVPGGRSVMKEIARLDMHCRKFIELSPFLVLGTSSGDGHPDVSPRGDAPGFVQIVDDHTLAIPDRPGNNRLDSLENILENPDVALIFLIPGVDETLRVMGTAEICEDREICQPFEVRNKVPVTVLKIQVELVYLHCAKALMRSNLWHPEVRVDRESLPSMGRMIADQIGSKEEPEKQAAMLERYRRALY